MLSAARKNDKEYQQLEEERLRLADGEAKRSTRRCAAPVERDGRTEWIVRPARKEPEAAGVLAGALTKKINRNRTKNLSEIVAFWYTVAGEEIARKTRVVSFRNGALQIAVTGAPLRQELEAFHREALLESLRQGWPVSTRLRNLKFTLDVP